MSGRAVLVQRAARTENATPAATQSTAAMVQDDPAALPEPEHAEADVDQHRPHQEQQPGPRIATVPSGFTTPASAPTDPTCPGRVALTPQLGLEPGLTRLDHRLHGTLDFLAGQRPLRMAEDHAEMDALLVLGQVSALERVEVLDRFQGRAGGLDHRLGTDPPTANPVPRPAKGRGPRPGTAAADDAGPPGSPCLNRTSNSSSAAEHVSRSSND